MSAVTAGGAGVAGLAFVAGLVYAVFAYRRRAAAAAEAHKAALTGRSKSCKARPAPPAHSPPVHATRSYADVAARPTTARSARPAKRGAQSARAADVDVAVHVRDTSARGSRSASVASRASTGATSRADVVLSVENPLRASRSASTATRPPTDSPPVSPRAPRVPRSESAASLRSNGSRASLRSPLRNVSSITALDEVAPDDPTVPEPAAAAAVAASNPAALPAGWTMAVSKSSGATFFFHKATGRKSRTVPVADAAPGSIATTENPLRATAGDGGVAAAAAATALPAGWRAVVSRSSGSVYYAHDDGRKTRKLEEVLAGRASGGGGPQ